MAESARKGQRQGTRFKSHADRVAEARHRFLTTIEFEAPEVLERLRADAWPQYAELYEAWIDEQEQPAFSEELIKEWGPQPRPLGIGMFAWPDSLKRPIHDWAREFHLTKDDRISEWMFRQIENTFAYWTRSHARPDRWGYVFNGITPDSEPHEDRTIEVVFEWHRHAETLKEFEERVLGALKAEVPNLVKDRVAEMEMLARQQHGKPSKNRESDNYKWAVSFQVREKRVTDIALSPEHRRTVDKGINKVLDLIGVTRRAEP